MSLMGLVLSGGQSRRMGIDKGALVYAQLSTLNQRTRCYEILHSNCDDAFISCQHEQEKSIASHLPRIIDIADSEGPARGILAAHRLYPNSAWLILACDFPFADQEAVRYLIENRNTLKAATSYINTVSGFLEPFFTIWEVSALQELERQTRQRNFSPRHALETLDCKRVYPTQSNFLFNANTPMDYNEATLSKSVEGRVG